MLIFNQNLKQYTFNKRFSQPKNLRFSIAQVIFKLVVCNKKKWTIKT